MKETMRPGSKRYNGPSMSDDVSERPRHPQEGTQVVRPDQPQSVARTVTQGPGKHAGSEPQRSVVAASAARPMADPAARRAAEHNIPMHRQEPMHTVPTVEVHSWVKGVPLAKKEYQHFSETLSASLHKVAADPLSVGVEIRKLEADLAEQHADQIKECNSRALAETDARQHALLQGHRAGWVREASRSPQQVQEAQGFMARYGRADPAGAEALRFLFTHSGLGDHPDMHRAMAFAHRQLSVAPTHYPMNAAKSATQGRSYRAVDQASRGSAPQGLAQRALSGATAVARGMTRRLGYKG